MEVRVAKASAAIIQQVPPAAIDRFMEWQRGVNTAAESFDGYQGTEVYPPPGDQPEVWVTVIHFTDDQALQHWLDSPVRSRWVEQLRVQVGEFELKKLPGGFGPWFAGLSPVSDPLPSSWKMALTVLFGLYPTVMLLTIFVGPYTSPLGFAIAMLIGNALSVSILQWAVMPVLMKLLGFWLKANMTQNKVLSIGGLALVVFLLGILVILFRQVTG